MQHLANVVNARSKAKTHRFATTALCMLLATCLMVFAVPIQALAYFDKGSVEVTLGVTTLEIEAGKTASVTVTISPTSDEQTDGCGMPSCPQYCGENCLDENGQCSCGGDEYTTYYADAVAYSSNTSVAIATYESGVLTIYARSEGTATITVSASLRQYTDGEATIALTVTGEDGTVSSTDTSAVVTPDEADTEAEQEDKAEIVEKTIMGSLMRYVRITDDLDATSELVDFAGTDGDITFWYGDTYYHPEYSLTITGTDYDEADVYEFDPELGVATEATGTLSKILEGLDSYVIVEFEQDGTFVAPVTVYALADDAIADDAEVSLYSYDNTNKCFVLEEAEAAVTGGYVTFTVEEGGTYAVSTRDLTTEATAVVEVGSNSGNTTTVSDDGDSSLPPAVFALIAILVLAVIIIVVVVVLMRRRKRAAAKGAAEDAGDEEAGEADEADTDEAVEAEAAGESDEEAVEADAEADEADDAEAEADADDEPGEKTEAEAGDVEAADESDQTDEAAEDGADDAEADASDEAADVDAEAEDEATEPIASAVDEAPEAPGEDEDTDAVEESDAAADSQIQDGVEEDAAEGEGDAESA